jgi:hypothetical protein
MAVRKRKKKAIKVKMPKASDAQAANRRALWKAYKDLQKRADAAWDKFRKDVKRSAGSETLIQDHKHLLLILGECDYMARECMRIAGKKMKKRR